MSNKKQQKAGNYSAAILIASLLVITISTVGLYQISARQRPNFKTERQLVDLPIDSEPQASLASGRPPTPQQQEALEKLKSVAKEPLKPISTNLKLKVVGDVMVHDTQLMDAKTTEGYGFRPMFAPVKPILSQGDLAIGNLETTMPGAERGYAAYPVFRTPDALAFGLKDAGFDVLTTANNHSLDSHFAGIAPTLARLDEQGIAHTGSFATEESSKEILIQEVNNIRLAVLAYTYGTNGIPIKHDWSINLINKEKIAADISRAQELEPDFIAVNIHFGSEYHTTQNAYQEDLANFLCASGVDLVFGSHPHVLQPMELRRATDHTELSQDCFIIYSLGNFIADQPERYKDSSVILEVNLKKDHLNDQKSIESVSYTPIWVDRKDQNGMLNFRVLPVEKAILDYQNGSDADISARDFQRLQRSLEDTRGILGKVE
jgi:poly-gamma-glutamate synthesis protein (capsule biosynthesis protein)